MRERSVASYNLSEPMKSALLYLLHRSLGEYPGAPTTWSALAKRRLVERYTSGGIAGTFQAVRLTKEGRRIAILLKESA